MKHRRRIFIGTGILLAATLSIFFLFWANDFRLQGHLRNARKALSRRDAEQAMASLTQAIKLNPEHGDTLFLLARTHRRQGHFDEMRQNLDKAVQFGFPQKRVQRERWLALAQIGKMSEAASHLQELLLSPEEDGPDICEAYANGFFLSYRFSEALPLLDAWERDFPDDPQPILFRGEFALATFSWSLAEKHFNKALLLAPDRWDIRLRLAKTQTTLQKHDEAARNFRELIKIKPDDPDVQIGWGRALLVQGRLDSARESFEAVLKKSPNHFDALIARGQLELSGNQIEDAIRFLTAAVAVRPHDSEGRYALANALQRAGRTVEAEEQFRFSNQIQEAQERLQKLLQQTASRSPKTSDLEARYEIAELLHVCGSPTERSAWLQSIVDVDFKQPKAHLELAKHYDEIGKPDIAAQHRLAAAGMESATSKP